MVEKVVKQKHNPTVTAVIGGAWGDEGKGKIALREAKDADLVIRSTGDTNTGYSIVFGGKKIIVHFIPRAIVYPQVTCLIGQGVAIDPVILVEEIKLLEDIGIPNVRERIKISGRASELANELSPMVVNGDNLVNEFVSKGKKIVLEGSNSYRFDKDLKETIVVLKAYFSKVGNGPFPTEQNDTIGEMIKKIGHEHDIITNITRRVGWFDAVFVRSSIRAMGPDYLCINRMDTLGEIGYYFGCVKLCTHYKYQGEVIDYYPDDINLTGEIPTPMYKIFKGGWHIPRRRKEYDELPNKAKIFIEAIEKETGIPVKYIGIGPGTKDIIERKDV